MPQTITCMLVSLMAVLCCRICNDFCLGMHAGCVLVYQHSLLTTACYVMVSVDSCHLCVQVHQDEALLRGLWGPGASRFQPHPRSETGRCSAACLIRTHYLP